MAQSLVFYDFEVFAHDWLMVAIKDNKVYRIRNRDDLETFWNNNRKSIFIGYNNRKYDQYIFKGILAGLDPKELNDRIIINREQGWELLQPYRQELSKLGLYQMINYDTMETNDVSPDKQGKGSAIGVGLKTLEAYLGYDIVETEVDFNLNRKLTPEEIKQTYQYCLNDVKATRQVFVRRKEEFEASLNLCKTFNLPITSMSKTRTRIAEEILQCTKQDWDDEYDFVSDIPFDRIDLGNYEEDILNWLYSMKINADSKYSFNPNDVKPGETRAEAEKRQYDKIFYSQKLLLDIHGLEHKLGFGGIHSNNKISTIANGMIFDYDIRLMSIG